jgi:hypothetical protein
VTAEDLPQDVEELFLRGRDDIAWFALQGLGIKIHEAQIEVAIATLEGDAQYYLLTWANRAGKTTIVGIIHMHRLFYKIGVPEAEDKADYRKRWLPLEYRTLHTAPLNELAGRAYDAWAEILRGVSPAQYDKETGKYRPAPLAPFFSLTKERDSAGADHMFLRCVTGSICDFRSTEGKARRLEAGAWRFISWDEWPQTENVDDIRTVLYVRLTNRAADFDAPILLTGTITDETEHIAQEFLNLAEDPEVEDWWGNHAERALNPNASTKAIERAERNLDPEDFLRTVMGLPGGAKGRLLPAWLLDPAFDKDLPRFTPPHPLDGAKFELLPDRPVYERPTRNRSRPKDEADESTIIAAPRGRFVPASTETPWTYLHLWDLALAAAANVGMVLRIPADWRFGWQMKDGARILVPILGAKLTVIPGSRTLTDDEIIHAIEETYLPYGGSIIVDSTDAHGKNVHRKLRNAGYPVEGFGFNERAKTGIIKKEQALDDLRDLLAEGMAVERDTAGKPVLDADGIPRYDRAVPFGVIRLPGAWTIVRDQASVLKVDNSRQTKDAAMALLMGGSVAYRTRRSRTRRAASSRFAMFAGGRRYRERMTMADTNGRRR